VFAAARSAYGPDGELIFACQATLLPSATTPLPWWDVRQYVEDFTSGNAGLRRILAGLSYRGYQGLINSGIGLGRPLRWLYDATTNLRRGYPYPCRTGNIAEGQRTPLGNLHLEPGDWVRVKSYSEILATLDKASKNRGLYFDAEMVPFCNGTYRVLRRVTRILDEKTGRLQALKTPCFILEGAACQSRYSDCRLFCPRAIYAYWRDIWLEKAMPPRSHPGDGLAAIEQNGSPSAIHAAGCAVAEQQAGPTSGKH
jgi:hypothetical protein